MTSPSQEVKPLTKEERETLAAVATETIAMELQPAFGEIIDAGDVAEARWRLRYEATIRESESRVSPGAATEAQGTFACPVCGVAKPHAHDIGDVHRQRIIEAIVRPAFHAWLLGSEIPRRFYDYFLVYAGTPERLIERYPNQGYGVHDGYFDIRVGLLWRVWLLAWEQSKLDPTPLHWDTRASRSSGEDQPSTKCESCGVPWKNIALTGRHADGCADGFDRGASLSPQPQEKPE